MRMISSFHASKCDEYSSITRTHNVLPRHRVRQPHVCTPHPCPREARPPRLPAPATHRGVVAIVRLRPETLREGREGQFLRRRGFAARGGGRRRAPGRRAEGEAGAARRSGRARRRGEVHLILD